MRLEPASHGCGAGALTTDVRLVAGMRIRALGRGQGAWGLTLSAALAFALGFVPIAYLVIAFPPNVAQIVISCALAAAGAAFDQMF